MSTSPARLIHHVPAAGAWNMALDEALVATHQEGDRPTLRFYLWSEPTLSLGYFKSVTSRHQHEGSRLCRWVRRATGGGAILHDRELTYSFVCSVSDRWDRGATQLYQKFHQTLADCLADWGIRAEINKNGSLAQDPEPFLCFQRRAVGDLLVGESKIAGSAQRRHRRSLLQHGSVLLGTSPYAEEIPGLAEITGQKISMDELVAKWTDRLAVCLNVSFTPITVEDSLIERATNFVHTKFGKECWNYRR